MTHAKKLKREIRARAAKTGESYTAARLHVLAARVPVAKPKSKPIVGNASVVKATGRGLESWFDVLDAFGAPAKGHTASAAFLQKVHRVPGWHAQMITGSYERARGLRVRNQTCTGTFQVGVSRAVNGSVDEVVTVMSGARWLDGADPDLARAFPKPPPFKSRGPKGAKLRYKWGASTIEINVTPRKGGATVVADNMKLAGTSEVESRRAQWRRALDRLRALFASTVPPRTSSR